MLATERQRALSAQEVQRFAAAAVPNLAATEVFVRMVEVSNAPIATAAPTCVKTEVLGVLICAEHRGRLASLFLAAICVSGFFAALMLIAILRALRYRKELTRLTATAPTAS